jgi:hypothetical protein
MFRFSIRELLLITAVVALVVGWWVEHRRQEKVSQENALLEWKDRVLELAWRNNGYELKIDGKSITLTGADETSVFTPMSYELNGKHSQVKMAFGPVSKLPNGDPLPEYYWPPRRSSP